MVSNALVHGSKGRPDQSLDLGPGTTVACFSLGAGSIYGPVFYDVQDLILSLTPVGKWDGHRETGHAVPSKICRRRVLKYRTSTTSSPLVWHVVLTAYPTREKKST